MSVPTFQVLMLPILRYLDDDKEHGTAEITNAVALALKVEQKDLDEKLPSGKQGIFQNRAAWARFYLQKAGLIDKPQRGVLRIAAEGKKLLAEKPGNIDIKVLERFPAFVQFRKVSEETQESHESVGVESTLSPRETMERAHLSLQRDLEEDLLRRLKNVAPTYFEEVVVQLLVKMGYGGSLADAGKAVGRSGDGGIDGIIKEDRLGLDVIYVQAKRWESIVGRPEIQKFVGALAGRKARKGVFITTSSFTAEAKAYVQGLDLKVSLMDGQRLAELMVETGLGVATVAQFEIKEIDSDFFEED